MTSISSNALGLLFGPHACIKFVSNNLVWPNTRGLTLFINIPNQKLIVMFHLISISFIPFSFYISNLQQILIRIRKNPNIDCLRKGQLAYVN